MATAIARLVGVKRHGSANLVFFVSWQNMSYDKVKSIKIKKNILMQS